ncbi:hypothetical protein JT318_gp65 [Pseudomonas phage PspYZU01]|uniref:C2H2-type domain-containing protein n=1 Tax=Pseudomonas phage PspYZU01 TaxID=1983555 RepID=A0A2U7N2B4_9CAUD|nr:hypothetical protein JT318_gp65 [Pseudomonas phage PspYZU01]ASD51950.1 hypothetical protein PspYZU01_65 [Pseudomonas phage PspYZU01]
MPKPLYCSRCHGKFASPSTLDRHMTKVRAPAGQTRCRLAEEMRYMGMHEDSDGVWFHSDNPRWAWSMGNATLDHRPASTPAPAAVSTLDDLDDLLGADLDDDLLGIEPADELEDLL